MIVVESAAPPEETGKPPRKEEPGDRHWRLVTQPDHARFSAQLGRLWRLHGLPEHPRREDLLFAAREHDNGWWELDAAPRWSPRAHRPHDFTSLPRPERHEMWLRGIERHRDERPWAALLIAEHARALHLGSGNSRADGDPEPGDFLRRVDTQRGDLLTELAATHQTEEDNLAALAARDYAWLDLLDLASLVVCQQRTEPFERTLAGEHAVEGRFEAATGTLHLEPFPLAGATTFEIPCRHLPARDYAGDTELAVALARARWRTFTVRVAPFA